MKSFILLVLALTGCGDNPPRALLTGTSPTPPPADVAQACALATTKCARCHPIDRVVVSRGIGMGRWEMYVNQMRLKPSSSISPGDASIILRCLKFVEEACVDCKQGRS